MTFDARKWHRRPERNRGLVWVVRAGHDLTHLSFGLVRLNPGERHRLEPADEERVVVLVTGTLQAIGPGFEFGPVGPRRSVFQDRASAVYVPPRHWIELEALDALEAAIIASPVSVPQSWGSTEQGGSKGLNRDGGGGARWIRPADVKIQLRGKPGFLREVHDIVDARVPAARLLVGETFNRAGEWSSYPPHKHDERLPGVETPLEEVYYFRIDPPQGFGVQLIYSSARGVDEAYRVLDGDVTVLPLGYHPVASAPGYRLYYLWALAGEERRLNFRDDPDHAWVSQ